MVSKNSRINTMIETLWTTVWQSANPVVLDGPIGVKDELYNIKPYCLRNKMLRSFTYRISLPGKDLDRIHEKGNGVNTIRLYHG
jgi:hypothetical protein